MCSLYDNFMGAFVFVELLFFPPSIHLPFFQGAMYFRFFLLSGYLE